VLVAALTAALTATIGVVATPGPQRPYRVTAQQMKALVDRIDAHRDAFHASFTRAIDRNSIESQSSEALVDRSLTAFEQDLDMLRDRLDDQRADRGDVDALLQHASAIDAFMVRNRLDALARSDWRTLRLDLETLARVFGMAWDWRTGAPALPVWPDAKQVDWLAT
jgi:hypothetical protein